MNWLYYLLEANIYLGIFYLAYCLFLNRDTHYQMSRAYLITCCVVSFLLPVLQIGSLRPVKPEPASQLTFTMPEPARTIAPIHFQPQAKKPVIVTQMPVVHTTAAPVIERHFTLQDGLFYAYVTGVAISLIVLFIKLFALLRMTGNQRSVRNGKYRIIYLSGSNVAFSFFNYLFIGKDTAEANTIITHELVHIRQKHSADIFFLELLKVINWFNIDVL